MEFNIIPKKLSVALVIFCLGMLKTLVADAEIMSERPSLIELFYYNTGRIFCIERDQTIWDDSLAKQKKSLDEIRNCDGLTETECTAIFNQELSLEISLFLNSFPGRYYDLNHPSKDEPINQESVIEKIIYIQNTILEFLIMRDAIDDDDLFNDIFDTELKKVANSDWMSIFKKDKNLYNEIASLKSFYPEIPYGENVCHKDQPSLDLKDPSKCFITQDGFINSVKTDRQNEMNAWNRLGTKKPITHLIRQESIKPCGTVTGAWAAKHSGHITFSTLVVRTPEGKRMPFDQDVLHELAKKIDRVLQIKRPQPSTR